MRALLAARLLALILAAAPAGMAATRFSTMAPAAPVLRSAIVFPAAVRERIVRSGLIEIPAGWRTANWSGRMGQGSCVHAALVHLLRWQGEHELAERWKAIHGDGETPEHMAAAMDAAGLQYAETREGDEKLLEWAMRTRRGAAVDVQNGTHMVNLVGLDRHNATILDSNDHEREHILPREEFLQEWKRSGGWAIVPIAGAPAAPDPWVLRRFFSEK